MTGGVVTQAWEAAALPLCPIAAHSANLGLLSPNAIPLAADGLQSGARLGEAAAQRQLR